MKLRLGLPKGSLQEATFQLFKQAGFNLTVRSRSYFPAVNDPELEVVLMRAQEIPRYVNDGVLDAGLSGLDWIMENEADVVEVADLVYAKNTSNPIRLVIAVSNDSNINTIYGERRIATELVQVTKMPKTAWRPMLNTPTVLRSKVPHLVDPLPTSRKPAVR